MMKTRNLLALGVLSASLLLPATSQAQDAHGFGSETQLLISADRLVPLFSWNSATVTTTQGNNQVKVTQSDSSTSLLWGSDSQAFSFGSRTPHTVPRAAADFVVIPHLTIGGTLAFAFGLGGSTKTETTNNNQTVTVENDSPSTTIIALGPRVGYIIPFGDVLAVWLRGGFSFYSIKQTQETNDNNNTTERDTTKVTAFSLDVDPQLVIVPLEHFFFTVGPAINIPLSGSVSQERVRGATTTTIDNDLTLWHFGISASVGGWFNL
jgi:hypothetical protein